MQATDPATRVSASAILSWTPGLTLGSYQETICFILSQVSSLSHTHTHTLILLTPIIRPSASSFLKCLYSLSHTHTHWSTSFFSSVLSYTQTRTHTLACSTLLSLFLLLTFSPSIVLTLALNLKATQATQATQATHGVALSLTPSLSSLLSFAHPQAPCLPP